MSRKRLTDIDRAKGLAISLVVFGHIVTGNPPANNEWYTWLNVAVYGFHMPFFMFLSGVIMMYTYSPIASFNDYKAYVIKKTSRLLPGFILFALLITVGKLLAQRFLYVDNIPADFIDGIINIVINPMQSSARSLWFIYVLWEFYIIFPLLLLLAGEKVLSLVLLGVFVHFIPATSYFALDQVLEYMLYFSFGILVARHYKEYEQLLDRYYPILLMLFILSFTTIAIRLNELIYKLAIGTFSIPALHSLVRRNILAQSNILNVLGKYTFSIYLMNTICIGFAKGIIFRFMSWDGQNFLFVFPVLLVSGIFLPIFIKKYVFSRIRFLNAITN